MIAVQKKLVVNFSPHAVVLSNKRFIAVHPSLFGMEFQDFPWREVDNVHMSEQIVGATLRCRTTTGKQVSINSIPKKQARRVYAFAQQIEELAYEKRQQIELEKMRAAAGGVVVHAPPSNQPSPAPAAAADDPVATLALLKKLREADLISDEEFAAKKADVLARL